jgi:hypothetical protein
MLHFVIGYVLGFLRIRAITKQHSYWTTIPPLLVLIASGKYNLFYVFKSQYKSDITSAKKNMVLHLILSL